MVSQQTRPRSNTSNSTSLASNRPKSRQSTISTQSNTTQVVPIYYQPAESGYNPHQPSSIYPASHDLAYPQAVQHTPNQTKSYGTDPLPQGSTADTSGVPYDAGHDFATESRMGQLIEASFMPDETDRQGSEARNPDGDSQDNNAESGIKKKKGAASSAANDVELRRLFRENEGRDLHEVALQVLENDKGPRSEKTKQIFGMLWLYSHCVRSKSVSVPRSRVFSSYANGCGTERVPPLNPASFGKLVRIIFPGIATRRLGIRGESKYHYVDLALITQDNHAESMAGPRAQSVNIEYSTHSRSASLRPQLPPENTAIFPSSRASQIASLNTTMPRSGMASASLYLRNVTGNNGHPELSRSNIIHRPLHFQTLVQPGPQGDTQLELPSIVPYLPHGIDEDAVSSLTSVYRSHCLLAIDNFRYCKTEKLCDSYKSLIGLLTVPGQKLLAHPQIAAWIRECDWLKYQKMTPLLDQILMTQVPRKAMLHVQHVASNLCCWISQFFQNQPQHIQDAMLGPANIFVSLLERFMRVNRACLDVANVLDSIPVRDQLWTDWIAHSNPYHVVQNSLQHHGHTRVLHILTQEVREMICPSDSCVFLGAGTMFERTRSDSMFGKEDNFDLANDIDASAVISRLTAFLRRLPTQFPNVDAKAMIMHIDVVGNSIQRNLSLNSAYSLGSWWKIKVFIDEMSSWLAEIGGFQDYGPDSMFPKTRPMISPFEGMEGSFGFGDAGNDFKPSRPGTAATGLMDQRGEHEFTSANEHNSIRGGDTAHVLPQNIHHTAPQLQHKPIGSRRTSAGIEDEALRNAHDDSGIGMGIDDEFSMDGKYGGFVAGVHGSDPADVVVC